MAALEAGQHFARLVVLAGLIVENAECGIASCPFGEQMDRSFQLLGGCGGISVEGGEYAEAPKNLSGARRALKPLVQSGLGISEFSRAKLNQAERQVIL